MTKLRKTQEQRKVYEQRYGMDFAAFKQAWREGRIPHAHSYEVERDYWEWEAAVADEERLQAALDNLSEQVNEGIPTG